MVIMNELQQTIVEKMKSIRKEQELTLEQASEITGISKAMLSQIERGQSMPTITTLWNIATGYKVPLTFLLQEEKNNYTLADPSNISPICEENNLMRIYTLFPYNPAQCFEMLYIEFDKGCLHQSSKHINGVEEYIYVTAGSLELNLNQETITLSEKQCFRFKADIPHSYKNISGELCTILNIIYYPVALPADLSADLSAPLSASLPMSKSQSR